MGLAEDGRAAGMGGVDEPDVGRACEVGPSDEDDGRPCGIGEPGGLAAPDAVDSGRA
ncbi:hypothetical protein [Streptomyces sp. CdTB01]|uniref:hypothetical protein n=1 Tax=Streptomyces sp. CdTB01 TaxID=1725411 RepID=UPI000AD77E51|nr:hypothetical protein [Streptomyces sp. CdTB01]